MQTKSQRQLQREQQKKLAYQRAYRRTGLFLAGFVSHLTGRMFRGKRKGK